MAEKLQAEDIQFKSNGFDNVAPWQKHTSNDCTNDNSHNSKKNHKLLAYCNFYMIWLWCNDKKAKNTNKIVKTQSTHYSKVSFKCDHLNI